MIPQTHKHCLPPTPATPPSTPFKKIKHSQTLANKIKIAMNQTTVEIQHGKTGNRVIVADLRLTTDTFVHTQM